MNDTKFVTPSWVSFKKMILHVLIGFHKPRTKKNSNHVGFHINFHHLGVEGHKIQCIFRIEFLWLPECHVASKYLPRFHKCEVSTIKSTAMWMLQNQLLLFTYKVISHLKSHHLFFFVSFSENQPMIASYWRHKLSSLFPFSFQFVASKSNLDKTIEFKVQPWS